MRPFGFRRIGIFGSARGEGPGPLHRRNIQCFPCAPCVANCGTVSCNRTNGNSSSRPLLARHLAIWPGTGVLRASVERVAKASIAVNSATIGCVPWRIGETRGRVAPIARARALRMVEEYHALSNRAAADRGYKVQRPAK